uniref:Uncharacterized protein n=1 Tax=Anguilla anguilla TaxID=7936 RepID=A0A0E9PM81_ANGAN
MSYNTFPLPAK